MILEVEKIVKKFHKLLPKYSNITFDFRDFNNDELEQGYIDAKFGFSNYHIVMSVSNYDGIFIDCRVEGHSEKHNCNCCEYEYNHSQDVDSTIKTAIDWIEKTLEEQKV